MLFFLHTQIYVKIEKKLNNIKIEIEKAFTFAKQDNFPSRESAKEHLYAK